MSRLKLFQLPEYESRQNQNSLFMLMTLKTEINETQSGHLTEDIL